MKFKKILCPTDFSDPAEKALKAAAGLAMDYSSELLVVNVVEPIPTISAADTFPLNYLRQYLSEAENASKKRLKELVTKVVPAKIKVRPLVLTGQAAMQIVDLADKKEVDLIVIATQGQTGLKRLVFGSVAERVLKLTSRPVLVIQTSGKAR
jgi:nucleotide-binding universal stress UspA family protein